MFNILNKFIFQYRRALVLLLTAVIAAMTYIGAFLLRIDGPIPHETWALISTTLPFVVAVRIGLALVFRLHCGLWRYASVDDLVRIVKAYTLGTLILIAMAAMIFYLRGIPRSVFFIDWTLGILILGGKRMSVRMLREWLKGRHCTREDCVRTLIAGAGDAGTMALRILNSDPQSSQYAVGFLDDDPHKLGMVIHGCPVVGTLAQAATCIRDTDAAEVLIALPTASKDVIRTLVESCAHLSVAFRILPAIADVVTGKLEVQPIREVRVEDLLGRDPIGMDRALVGTEISNECVLVTGAAGSIGSEIARQVAAHRPRHLLLMDIAESPLFAIDREIARLAPDVPRTAIIADVKNEACLDEIFSRHTPQRLFHAAAYKHVPLMEAHPVEAADNNVLGTLRLAQAAVRHHVKAFILISTDKAVRPCNVMGTTKRVAELIANRMNGNGTRFVPVRFGNVLDSNGSVIPIFKQQIAAGGPVTVTHPEMERFFMTIPEAVELVLQAGAMGEDGDLFVLDMGQQVRIRDLAENLIRLSGLRPGEDIEIVYTGLRPGEKLREELVEEEEDLLPTGVPKLNVLRRSIANPAHLAGLDEQLNALEKAVAARDEAAVRLLLREIADCEFSPRS